MRVLTSALTLLLCVAAAPVSENGKPEKKAPITYYWQERTVECAHAGNNYDITQCSLKNQTRESDYGEGCFEEFVPAMRNLRNLCPLHCQDSDERDFLAKIPTNNHKCNQYFNYGLTKFGNDVYLWRSGSCLNATIRFDLRCGFPFKPDDTQLIQNFTSRLI